MDSFHEPLLEDINWVEDIVKNSNTLRCDAPFGTSYVWRKAYNTKICRFEDFLLTVYLFEKGRAYCDFPLGNGDLKKAINYIIDFAAENKLKTFFTCTNKEEINFIESLYPGKFKINNIRDSAEYIYLSEDLAYLRGRKFHGKRNHLKKFKEMYNWSYEPIEKSNYEDALYVAKQWCKQHGYHKGDGLSSENCAIVETFRNFEQLHMSGGILKIDGKPVAMTVGEEITPDCFVVHFEKAVDGYEGAYAAINNMFSQTLTEYTYINREEDMGIEGLRKAKLSYRPVILLEKFSLS